jgi:hypothetical protein
MQLLMVSKVSGLCTVERFWLCQICIGVKSCVVYSFSYLQVKLKLQNQAHLAPRKWSKVNTCSMFSTKKHLPIWKLFLKTTNLYFYAKISTAFYVLG